MIKAQYRHTGFTLLEVLIGMSIMSVMMLLLFASLRVCVQNWNAGEKKNCPSQPSRDCADFFVQ
ncbi:hypothetical protein BAZMOX_00699_4 [methanotrophic endosymbiont of Bathymodiolus azoricus (Menez Gwen)]|nr:hypothetical protein BAZMOX_00699_4 [methanotrophic endosymbiont of Bathymodiolus azoricus (Menez Gwen)]